ncbi:hypothetical protein M8868_10475 [Pasteurella multocida]|uniref:Uncharacterized protein n=4 Tax=Pasteurella multocida TaxID=747 RepID=A0AAW8V9J9_PASMD|nr:hypothetical protein [Pasteurella multocida]ARA69624.1 hypothetical protein BTV67_03450 [Pasteurella multocida subsp. multocida]ARA70827.1 hypothetical protein BTV67_10035 [Pasteurella multocida subsp. multocida]ARA88720.1 hypothetical protein BTV66_03465 [Pasteurella multocida subsp. septica]ARA90189.1 hypothetical protein BTV66_11595 [Pasteurella multocida subsp. septica]AUK50046.1 hypothetical protein A4210_10025 [Pasteurella multocida]
MKKLFILITLSLFSLASFSMTDKAQKELEKALKGDYQTLRNVAFAMEQGSFGHDKNLVSACALRRVILFVNSDKADDTDYANELITCKNIHATENRQAWEIALTITKSLSN